MRPGATSKSCAGSKRGAARARFRRSPPFSKRAVRSSPQDPEGVLLATSVALKQPGLSEEDRRDIRLATAHADLLRGRPGDAFAKAIDVLRSDAPVEARCAAAEIVGASACRTGRPPVAQAAPRLAEAASAADRAGMHWARFLASAASGAVFRELEEPHRARAALHDAFEALERITYGLSDRSTMAALIAHPSVAAFRREVTALGDEVRRRRPRVDDESVARFLGGLKDALFEADRGEGPARRDGGEGLRGVLDVARSLAVAGNDAELHVRICDGLVHLFKAERAFLVLVDDKGRMRVPAAADGDAGTDRRPRIASVAEDRRRDPAVRDGTAIRRRDVRRNARPRRIRGTTLELRSVMAAPLSRDGRVRASSMSTIVFERDTSPERISKSSKPSPRRPRSRWTGRGSERERRRDESSKLS
jgi:hypothetical protein